MKEMRVWSLGWEDLLEEEVATHSRILTWKIPQTKEPGGLQSVGLQRVRHDLVTEHARTCVWKGKLTDIRKKKKAWVHVDLNWTAPNQRWWRAFYWQELGRGLTEKKQSREIIWLAKVEQLVALFGKAKLAVRSWWLSSFIFADWSALTLA